MVVVLCSSWAEAQVAYSEFVDFLSENEPEWFITKRDDLCCSLLTEEDIRYIFIDYRIRDRFGFDRFSDFVEIGTFFRDLMDRYYMCRPNIVFPRMLNK